MMRDALMRMGERIPAADGEFAPARILSVLREGVPIYRRCFGHHETRPQALSLLSRSLSDAERP